MLIEGLGLEEMVLVPSQQPIHTYRDGTEGRARLLTVRHGGKMRGNGHKSKQENMVQLDIGTNVTFFTTGFVRTLTFVGRSCDYFGFYLVTHKPIKEP